MIVPAIVDAAFLAIFDFRFRYFVTLWIVRAPWAIFVSIMLMLMAFVLAGHRVIPLTRGRFEREREGSNRTQRDLLTLRPSPQGHANRSM